MRRVSLLAISVTLIASPGAEAAFPGQNGKIAYTVRDAPPTDNRDSMETINPDGTGVTPVSNAANSPIAWSPSGKRIAFECTGIVCFINPDGSGLEYWYEEGQILISIGWAPDESRLVLSAPSEDGYSDASVFLVPVAPGTSGQQVKAHAAGGEWSPDGKRIAFSDGWSTPATGLQTIAPDGSGLATVPNTEVSDVGGGGLDWSPDGQRLLFAGTQDGIQGLFTIKLDGSDLTRITSAPSGLRDSDPAWSPDGRKIAFIRSAYPTTELFVVDAQGGTPTQLLAAGNTVTGVDWQPIPVNAYPRPKGASPTRVSLVPAYEPCTSPDRTHGPPLAFGSCSAPTQSSGQLTVGSPDANGRPAKSVSYLRVNPVRGDPSTPDDEADVRLRAIINDVRVASDLSDYTGDLEARLTVKITDRDNTPHPGGPGAGTVQAFTHSQPISCAATGDTTVGSNCDLDTTVEALVPGAVKELTRAIWELGAIRVHDGAGNLFMTQGIFVP